MQESEYALSDDEAKELILNFGKTQITTRSTSKTLEVGERKHTKNYAVTKEDGISETIPVYEYAIHAGNKEGYALVIGDSRISKVLAFVDEGSMTDTTFIEPLKLFTRSIPAFLTIELRNCEKDVNESDLAIQTRSTVISSHSCFLLSNWGQAFPYNAQCPLMPGVAAKYNGRAPAGCVPVAMAQIIAYKKYQAASSLWFSILANPTLSSTTSPTLYNPVAEMIHDIGEALDISYGTTGSGVSLYNIANTAPSLFTSYEYNVPGIFASFSYSTVKYALSAQNYPVMMVGFGDVGHAWVCDAFQETGINGNVYDKYLHMNWGWNGSSNGFFYVNESAPEFDVGVYYFYYDFYIIHSLH